MMEELRASSSWVSHTSDMRWQSMDSRPFHTLLKSCAALHSFNVLPDASLIVP